jgi:hypothetical protein
MCRVGAIGPDYYCITPTDGTPGMRMTSKSLTENQTIRFAVSVDQKGRGKGERYFGFFQTTVSNSY